MELGKNASGASPQNWRLRHSSTSLGAASRLSGQSSQRTRTVRREHAAHGHRQQGRRDTMAASVNVEANLFGITEAS